MERRPVASKGIEWVRYDEANHVLEVRFASSRAYRYLDVPPAVYEWLLRAESKGKFVNRLVKEKYAYERIDEESAPPDLEALLTESIRRRPDAE